MKKELSLLCASALMITSLAGCGTSSSNAADYSNTTLVGQVQSINGQTVTLQLGELSQQQPPASDGQGPSGKPSDKSQTPPSGASAGGQSSDSPNIDQNDPSPTGSQQPPEQPSGQAPSDGKQPSDQGEGPGGPGGPGGGMTSFTAGNETATITISQDAVITIEGTGDQTSEGTMDDITTGAVLEIAVGEKNTVTSVTVKRVMSGGGNSDTVSNGTSANTITDNTTVNSAAYTSTADDENALRIDGADVTLNQITVEKPSGESSSTENGDFYGQNAGLLALNGANVTLNGATVTTGAQNGNGVFSYGEGTVMNISNTAIHTSGDNSGGIQTAGGGTTNATDLDIETQGNSSAAIRSDRGGGTVTVDGGSYVTNGNGSPTIYSTADITVSNATLNANHSEAVVVEGKNSVNLVNCDVTGDMTGTYQDSSENIHNVMIYQSMSGDADVGQASFSMSGGSLTAKAGDLFYVTNTSCSIVLANVKLALANENLLTIAGNSSSRGWGTEGKNGGQVTLSTDAQTLTGLITCDQISSLDLSLKNESSFEGAINTTGQGGTVHVSLDSSSTWTLTGDCYLTSLDNSGTIHFNGHTIYLADGTTLTA
ncbi:MAG: hypothetical protein LKK00_07355 [Intestinimonas sp.]|nr:hypothetical protein [Intestinimonas sp.]